MTSRSDNYIPVYSNHLGQASSSQWLIGREFTRKEDLEHMGRNGISFVVHNKKIAYTWSKKILELTYRSINSVYQINLSS